MKTFTGQYGFDGRRWSFEFMAESYEDAEDRLKSIKAWGKLDGELVATVPAFVPVPLLLRIWNWVRGV